MASPRNLNELFVHKIRRVYDAEQRLTKALPKMADAANASDLKQAFRNHLRETETHIERLQRLFGMFDQKPDTDTSDSIKGLIKDGDDAIDMKADGPVKDASLIAAAQEAEHYEIGAYGTLRTWAEVLGRSEAVQLLEWTLEEEKKADHLLTQIAGRLNFQAATTSVR